MSNPSNIDKEAAMAGSTVSFADKFINSAQFQAVFQEGMSLVEEASGYLDNAGREDSKKMDSNLSFAYATESMRLTTRLMQVASWLLIKRAVNDGDMTTEQADQEEAKLNIYNSKPVQKVENFEQLPETLRQLVNKSFAFYERMGRIDHMMKEQQAEETVSPIDVVSPVSAQMATLESAFGQRRRRKRA